MIGLSAPLDRAPRAARDGRRSPTPIGKSSPTALAWAALIALWTLQVPLFLAMPITNDAAVYDIQARQLLQGGTLYRDIFEPNLPGVVWLHAAVRAACGWSSEALRAFDLAVFAGILLLAAGHVRRSGGSAQLALWTVFAVSSFYFAGSEWIHCQRDTWMLLPALAALELRGRQAARLRHTPRAGSIFGWGLVEGLVWGLAVWIKPHVLIPAAAAWLVVTVDRRPWRTVVLDACGLLTGGVAVGALGIGWLVMTDAWPHFVATIRDWNPRYLKAGKEHWTLARFVGMNVRMFPWPVVHLAGALAAFLLTRRWLKGRARAAAPTNPSPPDCVAQDARLGAMLIVGCYAAWTVQAFVFQHLFDYVHAPPILLGMLSVAACLVIARRQFWNYATAAAALLAIALSPLLRMDRLSVWPAALQQGSTPELRDRLRRLAVPNWTHLEEVAEYLEAQQVQPGEVLSVNDAGVHLYTRLRIRPPTRFCYIEQSYFLFPEYRPELRQLIAETPHRFAVVNLIESGFSGREAQAIAHGDPLAPPPLLNTRVRGAYPWTLPIAYRAGPYLVFRVDGPKGKLLLPAPRQKIAQAVKGEPLAGSPSPNSP